MFLSLLSLLMKEPEVTIAAIGALMSLRSRPLLWREDREKSSAGASSSWPE
jgi:hypothetical protein